MKPVYEQIIDELKKSSREDLKKFNAKIINTSLPILGVKTPSLRKIADRVFRENPKEFLKDCKFEYFEDTLIYGLIIAKLPFDEFVERLDSYLSKCDSWAHIDSFVPRIKCTKKEKERFFEYLKVNLKKFEGYKLRFIIVSLMVFYLSEENLDFIFETCENYDGKGYYTDMAIAWLISVAFVKFEEQTFNFIKNSKLSTFTHNKAISKIRDSYRVTKENKVLLKNFLK